MSDLDILVREKYEIPEDEDTVEFCEKHDIDYANAIRMAYLKGE